MKIGIYINNSKICGVDCVNLEMGNPGIGGTEYSVLLLAESLSKYGLANEVYLFCASKSKLPQVTKTIICENIIELPEQVKENKCDLLIIAYSSFEGEYRDLFLQNSMSNDISIIAWGHNYYFSDDCDTLADCEAIKANVFVGKQQYDKYIDHRINSKSTYIYNMCPRSEKYTRDFKKSVTYIGSLVESKGFHVLASIWKLVVNSVPEAQLYIIGSGKLYNESEQLGEFGIAEETYERQFIENLSIDGNLMDSVHFLGLLGKEKEEVIMHTTVGVANPTGRTETFGISAVDFESRGVPVVTIAKGGFLDTVLDGKTGLLFKTKAGFLSNVIKLLEDTNMNIKYGESAYSYAEKFSISNILPMWEDLIADVAAKKELSYQKPTNYYFSDLKWLRIINRLIKKVLNINKGLSVIQLETIAWKLLYGKR